MSWGGRGLCSFSTPKIYIHTRKSAKMYFVTVDWTYYNFLYDPVSPSGRLVGRSAGQSVVIIS